MTKVLFDITPTQWFANGSGVYTTTVFEKALEMGYIFDCLYSNNLVLPDNVRVAAKKNGCRIIQYNNCDDIKSLIRNNKYDRIYFGALSTPSCHLPEQVEIILTLHDIRSIEVPNDKYRYLYRNTFFSRKKQWMSSFLFPLNDAKKMYYTLSKFINHPRTKLITVSNHSKYSLLQFFPTISKESISVLYCPFPNKPKAPDEISENNFLKEHKLETKKYFLIISANRWIKNSLRALKACDELLTSGQFSDKKIFVIGNPSTAIINKLRNKKSFIFVNYLPNENLQILYKNAFCFIYPSLQEGFGIPPIEAMGYGTPVLASGVSSIPEICGEGILYFNPYSISEIKNRILMILNDFDFRDRLVKKSERHLINLYHKQQTDLEKLIKIIFN